MRVAGWSNRRDNCSVCKATGQAPGRWGSETLQRLWAPLWGWVSLSTLDEGQELAVEPADHRLDLLKM